jgi:hypothetical protein
MVRADNAELRIRETATKFTTATAEAATAKEELRLYKIQYTNIQRELERAQAEYDRMVESKRAAEDVATAAKQEMRRISMEREVERAKAEAKREGIEEGYRRGIQDGLEDGQYQEQQRAIQAYEKILESNQGQSLRSLAQFAGEYFRVSTPRTHVIGISRRPVNRPNPTILPRARVETVVDTYVPDAAPIVDNLPMRTLATPILQSDIGRQVSVPDSDYAPPSARNAPISPVIHGTNIDSTYIPSSDDGRIDLPPPHEIDRNPALSPTPSTTNLEDSQRTIGVEGGNDFNGALPLQTSQQVVRRSHPADGASPPPPSASSASTHISNFAIVRDTTDFNNQDSYLSGGQRGVLYRNAVSPGLSVIPEGSNVDASSPDFTRRTQDIEPEPIASPSRSWSRMSNRWVDQPAEQSGMRDSMRYSNPEETASRMRCVLIIIQKRGD